MREFWEEEGEAMTERKQCYTTWPRPRPRSWMCPRCRNPWLTPDLTPRCAICGMRESVA